MYIQNFLYLYILHLMVPWLCLAEQQLMVLPVKSINIKIEEMMPSESRIQIRNCEGETVYVIG